MSDGTSREGMGERSRDARGTKVAGAVEVSFSFVRNTKSCSVRVHASTESRQARFSSKDSSFVALGLSRADGSVRTSVDHEIAVLVISGAERLVRD